MNATDVAAALLSALLHAGWNAAVKANPNPARAMTAQMAMSALLVVPLLLWSGLPAPAAWPWIAASTLLNVLTITALLRAYELGGFGIVYPVVRALAVLLVVPLAAGITGDRPGPAALLGIAIIAASLGLLGWDAARDRGLPARALVWILIAGIGTAAYVLSDAQGVRAAGSPWAYGCVVSVTNAAAMGWRQRHVQAPWRYGRGVWAVAFPTAVASVVSYLLILFVWSHAPVAPAAALRDTSAIFALLIAVVWLREPFTRLRLAAIVLAAAAVPLLRLG